MPKVSRKDTGDATHTRERGDAKQTRASVATPDESARADLPRGLHKVRVDGGPERPPRPSSPDSPLCFEPREDPHVHALARDLCALAKEQGKAYEGLYQAVRERLSMIMEGKPTPPMNDAADELSRKGAEMLRNGHLQCVNSDPAASLRQENGAREVDVSSWQRSSDALMVNSADAMERLAPTSWRHMARKHDEPCFTQQISMMFSAYVNFISLPFSGERDDIPLPPLAYSTLTALFLFRRTVHGVTAETAEDARPPPPRTINAVPGHTTRADEPELLKPDGSLAVPERYNFLIDMFAPATYGVAIRENEHVDVLRVRGADNVRGAVRYFKLNDVDLVAFPPHFYVALGIDPVLAQAVPESSATPWGGHLAVRKGMLPFFVYFDLHPGSTLCGPNSRFWDAERIFFSLLASANFERAIARRPPIDMCESLFCLHNVDPAAAGQRVTVDGDGAEWTVPCVRGGRTTKEKWRRLQEEAENGTISDEDAEEFTYLLACSHLGGQMTREKWQQLLADEEAGTIGKKDRDYLAYLRACAARGGRTTKEKWRRLQEEAENGTISDEDAEELTYLLASRARGGATTGAEYKRLLADEEAGTIGMKDRDYLAYLRACAARGGATAGAEYKRLSEAGTLTELDRAKLERLRDGHSRGGKANAEEYKRLSEAITLTELDRAKLERQRAQNVARAKKGAEKRWGAVTTLNDELEAILTENQGKWMTLREVYAHMEKRGFVNLTSFKNFQSSKCVKKHKNKSSLWEHRPGTSVRPTVFRLSDNATTAGAGQTCIDLCDSDSE